MDERVEAMSNQDIAVEIHQRFLREGPATHGIKGYIVEALNAKDALYEKLLDDKKKEWVMRSNSLHETLASREKEIERLKMKLEDTQDELKRWQDSACRLENKLQDRDKVIEIVKDCMGWLETVRDDSSCKYTRLGAESQLLQFKAALNQNTEGKWTS